MNDRVPFPEFGLVGPECPVAGCRGVLVDHADLKTKEVFRQCSVCKAEAQREPGAVVLERFSRTVERILK